MSREKTRHICRIIAVTVLSIMIIISSFAGVCQYKIKGEIRQPKKDGKWEMVNGVRECVEWGNEFREMRMHA